MEGIVSTGIGRLVAIRLDPGEDILESITTFLQNEGIRNAVIISGIGTVDKCCLHFVTDITDPTKMDFKTWYDEPLEVVSIEGIIADGVPHLHMVISNNRQAWAGHIEPGCRVLFLCEIMIMETTGFMLTRVPKNAEASHPDSYIRMLTVQDTPSPQPA